MAIVKFRFAPAKERSVESRQEAKELGETGEQMAARYLEEQGCVILERHYRKEHKEVDIIALDHGELAVIEVKTRTNEDYFAAEQAVDHRKRQNIIRVANNYVRSHHRTEPLRFDIIAIVGSGATAEIRHTKNAFNVLNY
ncbi:MAG: YraN family protein [Bacteroidales bacterium]|nr:YraN family protein [Bacteroidales bacterium]